MKNKIICCLLFPFLEILAQESDTSYLSEYLFLSGFTSETGSDFIEYLESFEDNPVNINTAEYNELSTVPFLTHSDILSIISYREKTGGFFSTSELYAIKELVPDKTRRILPFVTTENKKENSRSPSRPIVFIRSRIKQKEAGSFSNLNRIKAEIPGLKGGILTERDDGEKTFTDFLSGYLMTDMVMKGNKIIAGDFSFESGQGIVSWGSSSMGKNSGDVSSLRKSSRGLIPYSSSNESRYFRGIGIQQAISDFSFDAFYSRNYSDGLIDNNGDLRIYRDGYHRTEGEITRKNKMIITASGTNLVYSGEDLRAGITFLSSTFKYAESRKTFNNYSAELQIRSGDLIFFSEAACNYSAGLICGINLKSSKELEIITLFRNYSPGFLNIYGSSFSEHQEIKMDETGFYMAASGNAGPVVYYLSLDHYKFITSQDYLPCKGSEFNAVVSSLLSKGLKLNFKYRFDTKETETLTDNYFILSDKVKQNFRSELSYTKRPVHIKIRAEYVLTGTKFISEEKGFMISGEIKSEVSDIISIACSGALFSTSSFNSAIYIMESGAPGLLENKILFGEGARLSGAVRLKIPSLPAIYLKFGRSIKQYTSISNASDILVQAEFKY